MKNKFITRAIFLSLISIIFFSCEDDMISKSGVSGNIYYENLTPASNKKVRISDATILTGPDGSFSVDNVIFPYDVTIIDSTQNSYPEYTIYKNLSTENVNLILNNNGSTTSYSTHIQINFTENIFVNGLEGKLIFTNGEYINSYFAIQSLINNNTIYFPIGVPNTDPVTGKIILLTFKKNNEGEIISYENYGEIDNVTINFFSSDYVTFDSAAISTNPGEVTVSGSANLLPGENQTINSYFYLSFTDKKFFENIYSTDFGNVIGDNFNFLIPTDIPVAYDVILKKEISAGGGILSGNYLVHPGKFNNLKIESPSLPITPEHDASNVTDNTYFNYSTGGGTGVYDIFIRNSNVPISYRIITASESFTMNDIQIGWLESFNENEFQWLVRKHVEFSSMNDYVINNINKREWFSTRSYSHRFQTAY